MQSSFVGAHRLDEATAPISAIDGANNREHGFMGRSLYGCFEVDPAIISSGGSCEVCVDLGTMGVFCFFGATYTTRIAAESMDYGKMFAWL